jgi:phage repressor protein C with HTH and peptisase S24 domain/DNA-binding XRE family transcriptional regulator
MNRYQNIPWSKLLTGYRTRSGLTKAGLARAVGVSIGYISKLETDKKPPPEDQRRSFCEAMGLSEEEAEEFHIQAELERSDPIAVKYLMKLAGRSSDEISPASSSATEPRLYPGELTTIPIINKAAAGFPQEFTDLDHPVGVADGYIAVPDISDPNAFGFYASGDSMEPDYPDGTLLIAAPNSTAEDGDPCFVRFSMESRSSGCTFKRVYTTREGRVRLVPINRHYEEQIYDREELAGIWPVVRWYGKIGRRR